MTTDLEQALSTAFTNAGISPPSVWEATGTIIRFPTNGDRVGHNSGWYLLYDGDPSCCIFGCWKDPSNKSYKWLSRDTHTFTEEEKAEWKARQDAARRKRDKERERLYQEQRPVFRQIMDTATTDGLDTFPYVVKKKIFPAGAFLSEHRGITSLVIPRHKDGELVGIQKIEADGKKKYMYGSQAQGSYLMMPGSNPKSAIILCEGWATGCTLYQALDCNIAVAFDAGNLMPVAKSLAADYPTYRIVIAADDDHDKPINTGITKATEVAKQFKWDVLTPEFLDPDGLTDFNDMAVEQGLDAVRNSITSAVDIYPKPPLFANGNDLLNAPLDVSYLIHKVLERDSLVEIFGPPGSGKSFVAIDMALSVATGQPWANYQVKQGMCVYFAGEGFGGLSRRVKAWHFNQPHDLSHFHLSRSTIAFNAEGLNEAEVEINELEAEQQTTVALVVIDTLARHMMGDENSTSDMSKFIQCLDTFRVAFPHAVVLIVHHTGHTTGERGRGSSALKGAVEAEIQCLPVKGGGHTLTWTKMKDGETPYPLTFDLNSVVLGYDEYYSDITSCYPTYARKEKAAKGEGGESEDESGGEGENSGAGRGGKTAKPLKGEQALRNALAHSPAEQYGIQGTTLEAWRSEVIRLYRQKNKQATPNAVCQEWTRTLKACAEIADIGNEFVSLKD